MGYYSDKTVLVTGGASGIGRALGERLLEEGARVVLADVNATALGEVTQALGCHGVTFDVRDVAAVEAEHGPIEVVFHNAGVAITGEAHRFAYEDWKRVIDVNLYGVVNGVHAIYPRMVRRGRGHIVNVASIAGLFPSAGQVSYVASKYAVVGLSHALRAEAAGHGVRVSVVCPGIIKTPMREGLEVKAADASKLDKLLPEGMPVERCVEVILKGVGRNKATIVVTGLAHALYAMGRVSPSLTLWLNEKALGRLRAQIYE